MTDLLVLLYLNDVTGPIAQIGTPSAPQALVKTEKGKTMDYHPNN